MLLCLLWLCRWSRTTLKSTACVMVCLDRAQSKLAGGNRLKYAPSVTISATSLTKPSRWLSLTQWTLQWCSSLLKMKTSNHQLTSWFTQRRPKTSALPPHHIQMAGNAYRKTWCRWAKMARHFQAVPLTLTPQSVRISAVTRSSPWSEQWRPHPAIACSSGAVRFSVRPVRKPLTSTTATEASITALLRFRATNRDSTCNH